MTKLTGVRKATAFIKDSEAENDERFDLADLAVLSALPSLSQLDVQDWTWIEYGSLLCRHSFQLGSVERLRVSGNGADGEAVAQMVEVCPRLLHLEVVTFYEDRLEFKKLLPRLPVTLHSLKLDAPFGYPDHYDPFLPRFSHLRSIDLGDCCYSSDIHSALARLPLLAYVRLGEGSVNAHAFLSLVSGPSCLVHLEAVVLDTIGELVMEAGRKVLPPSHPSFSVKSMIDPEMDDWNDFQLDLTAKSGFNRLVEVAKDNGVKVGGTLFAGFRFAEDYWTEANNRAVLAAFHRKDCEPIQDVVVNASASGYNLSPIPVHVHDLDYLEFADFEMVETEIPEKEWYILSLKEKNVRHAAKEGKEEKEENEA
jgi:hypothetical protein